MTSNKGSSSDMGQLSRSGAQIEKEADRWHVQWADNKVELFAPNWKLVCGSRDSGNGALYEQIAAAMNVAVTPASEKQSTEPERFEATDEFKQLASFYDVLDVAGLVRAQEERIEDMRKQLPPTPPFPGIQRAREG